MSIFSDMVEDTIEVFMDDFSVVGDSFERCLTNLSEVLKRCEDCNFSTKLGKVSFLGERGYCVGSSHFRKGHRG